MAPYVTVELPERHHDTIVAFRQEICSIIGLDPHGLLTAPLPFAAYLFVYPDQGQAPAGMVEFFFYDQAYDTYAGAPYSQAADLEQIAPMHQMAHVRSVILTAPYRQSRLFQYLCMGMTMAASHMGARFITAGTGLHNHSILALHRKAGMRKLGTYTFGDGAVQQLSLLDLEPIARRVMAMQCPRFLHLDPSLLQEVRHRKR